DGGGGGAVSVATRIPVACMQDRSGNAGIIASFARSAGFERGKETSYSVAAYPALAGRASDRRRLRRLELGRTRPTAGARVNFLPCFRPGRAACVCAPGVWAISHLGVLAHSSHPYPRTTATL